MTRAMEHFSRPVSAAWWAPKGMLSRLAGTLATAKVPTAQRTRLQLAIVAGIAWALNALMMGLVLAGAPAFERTWAFMDASPWLLGAGTVLVVGPVVAVLVVDGRSMSHALWSWQQRATHLLIVLSLGYLGADVVVLRGPWLIGQAGRLDRITVWTALLSSAVAGVPLVAFALALGFAATSFCLAAACIRTYRAGRPSSETERTGHVELVIWLLCTGVIVLGVAAITTFATGGSV